MANKYFQKEIEQSPVIILGQQFRFDILETSDSTLIAELDKCVARGVGGVTSITKEQYEEENKKKALVENLRNNSRPQQRQELSALRLDARRVVEAVSNPAPNLGMFAKPQVAFNEPRHNGHQPMPEPIEVPTPESFVVKPPPTSKMKAAKAV